MRVSRTPLALAALLLVAACGTGVDSPVAPESMQAPAAGQGSTGVIGAGSFVPGDSTFTAASHAEDGGIGLLGSGN